MKVDIITPEEYMGDVIGDINSRRGSIVELTDRNGLKQVESTVPLANMFQVRRRSGEKSAWLLDGRAAPAVARTRETAR